MDLTKLVKVSGYAFEANHACKDSPTTSRKYSVRSSLHLIQTLYRIVVNENERAQELCDKCGFSSVFQFDFSNADRGLVEAIAERWWETTRSFHFKDFEVGLLPLDWYMLTGIPTGLPGKTRVELPRTMGRISYPAMDDLYFQGVKARNEIAFLAREADPDEKSKRVAKWNSKCNTVTISSLRRYIQSREGMDNKECADELTRMFFLWCFGQFLVPNKNNTVDKKWCLLLADLDKVGDYDWGMASLGHTYKYLDLWSSKAAKDMSGMMMVIEYWYYYYFHNYHPVLCPEKVLDDGLDVFPKIALFKKENLDRCQTGLVKHKWKIAREQIDQRATTTIIWQPWSESQFCRGEHWEHAYELSKRRVWFQDLYETKRASCYLGERFRRQLTNEIVIPCNPPKLDEVIHMDDVVEGYHYWVVDQQQYSAFWVQNSVGPYNMIGHRSQNTDHVGVGSHLLDPRLLPNSMPPTLLSQDYLFDHIDPPQTLPEIQWSVPFYSETQGQDEVPVPMPSSCPVDFRAMNMTQDQTYGLLERLYGYYNASRDVVYQESMKRHQSSSSSGYSTSSIPSVSTPRPQVELSLGGTYEQACAAATQFETPQGYYEPMRFNPSTSQDPPPQRRRLNEFDEMVDDVDVVRDTQYPTENQNSVPRWGFF